MYETEKNTTDSVLTAAADRLDKLFESLGNASASEQHAEDDDGYDGDGDEEIDPEQDENQLIQNLSELTLDISIDNPPSPPPPPPPPKGHTDSFTFNKKFDTDTYIHGTPKRVPQPLGTLHENNNNNNNSPSTPSSPMSIFHRTVKKRPFSVSPMAVPPHFMVEPQRPTIDVPSAVDSNNNNHNNNNNNDSHHMDPNEQGVENNPHPVDASVRSLPSPKTPESRRRNTILAHPSDDNDELKTIQKAAFLKLLVDDYSAIDFYSLLDALRSNQIVQTIVIVRKRQHDGALTRTNEEMDILFQILRTLSSSLVELQLRNGQRDDLSSFSLWLFDHPSLLYLQLHLENDTLDEVSARTLAFIPRLVFLEVEVNESFPVWALTESKSLAVLSVVGIDKFRFESEDIVPLAEKLRKNTSLQTLDLEPLIPVWCLRTIMASIQSFQHESALETFQFSCRTISEKEGDACMGDILNALSNPTSKLRVVWNHCYESFLVSHETPDKTLPILFRSKTLEQFHVFFESEQWCKGKCRMLDRKPGLAMEKNIQWSGGGGI
jgi:hypothetical protein